MPPLIGHTVQNALSILAGMKLSPEVVGYRKGDSVEATWVIVAQAPSAGDTVGAATSVVLTASNPLPIVPLWAWIAGGLLLTAAATTTVVRHHGRKRVAEMSAVPYFDAGRPRVVLLPHDGESPDAAFARIGLRFTTVADAGTQRLHATQSPQPRDETTHV